MLEAHGFVARDNYGNVAIYRDMVLGFGPWCFDRDEDVVAAEDSARLLVHLLTGEKEVEVESVFLVLVPSIEFVVNGAEDFVVDGLANFPWQA